MGQREDQAPEETKEQGQKHLVMQPGRTTVSPHSPRGVAKELCKSETAAVCVRLQDELCLPTQMTARDTLGGRAPTTALLLGPQGEMSECKEEAETREQEIRPWGSPGAGAEACWGMLWGAAPRGKEHSPARQVAHKLETNPQPHRSPPQTTGQAGFCITLTFVPSHIVFKLQVWPICSCPVVR